MSTNKKNLITEYGLLTFGTLLMSCGIYFFKFPNNFSTGGVSAISIIVSSLIPDISAGTIMLVLNIFLLLVGFAVFGKGFTFKTAYCSILLSVLTRVFEIALPMEHAFSDEKLLELFFATALIAVGSAILFSRNASSGGTDVVAMLLKKYTRLDIGKALLCSDFILALASAFIFDIETGMFSVFGLILKSFVVDNIIDSINLNKWFIIITDKENEVCSYITETLHRGATKLNCLGSFTNTDKHLIITVLNRGQAAMLKRYIKEVDSHAFSIITNSSDILGKGFRTVV